MAKASILKSLLAVLVIGAGSLAAIPGAAAAAQTATPAQAPAKSGHVETGGVNYYYEVRGSGEPLLLLHGGLGSIDMFQPVMPVLAAHRQIIAVDLQGHGRTPLGQRPIDLKAIGDDMGQILAKLGYGQVDVLGYSMGGGVAFQLAAQHPDKVRRLVLVSAGFAQDGFYPEMLPMQAQVGAGMAEMMKATPMYQSYVKVAPDPAEFPRLLDAMGALMRKPYDWSSDVPKLTMPVMLIFGDSDMYRPEHVIKFYQLLGGGLRDAGWQREHMAKNRLAILPGRTHYDIFLSPQLTATALPFLDGTNETANWSDQTGK
ncbi:alpha/beta fold hydrolase [Labrys sp. LIt4]|uniref:alpha/beta fold hydrolase n=1 Tax=Labrys sp. LIt4 TaxID=2821355 RepID=UPI001AE0893B|nr:alpha/beta fold hydrolase [Labrys sp. LIt4]MBP0582159.1 alpha/beta fold hydrolase [Labrys sp. LIt4]